MEKLILIFYQLFQKLQIASVLTDTIINHLLLNIEEKQSFLEIIEPLQRVEKLIVKIDTEISVLVSEKKVRSRVKNKWKKHNVNII